VTYKNLENDGETVDINRKIMSKMPWKTIKHV